VTGLLFQPVKYLHNNCSEIAFRRQIESLRADGRARAYVMVDASGDDGDEQVGCRGRRSLRLRPPGQFNKPRRACRASESWPPPPPDIIGGLATERFHGSDRDVWTLDVGGAV